MDSSHNGFFAWNGSLSRELFVPLDFAWSPDEYIATNFKAFFGNGSGSVLSEVFLCHDSGHLSQCSHSMHVATVTAFKYRIIRVVEVHRFSLV